KTTSLQEWAARLESYAQSEQALRDAEYWLEETSGTEALLIDQPYVPEQNTLEHSEHIEVTLPALETRIVLETLPEVYHTQINDVLLTALAQVLTQWNMTEDVLIDLEGHGREDLFAEVDLSRTVGWFTSIFPVKLTVKSGASVLETLKGIKEHLRLVPHHGIGYGILRYLSHNEALIAALKRRSQPQVVFNYLG